MSQPVVKTFSATMARDREALGDKVTDWLKEHPDLVVTEIRTMQSSDAEYHCLSIIVLARGLEEYVRPAPMSMPGEPEIAGKRSKAR